MRVYVAGSGSEVDRVRRVMVALRAAGHTITCDWSEEIREGVTDAGVDDERALACALADIRGIESCGVFLLLRNRTQTTFGAAFEAGVASQTLAPRLIVVGSRAPIFLRRWEHFETDEAAVAALGGRL